MNKIKSYLIINQSINIMKIRILLLEIKMNFKFMKKIQ